MSYDYHNGETRYERVRDPREVNVAERIQNEDKLKAELPRVEDDHVCITSMKKYVSDLENEVFQLKNDKLVAEIKALLSAGGDVVIEDNVDMDTAVVIEGEVNLNLNGKTISVSKDTAGDGVFRVTNGILTIDGNGTINGVGNNDYNMAIWADGGSVIINGGTITNEGATATDDPTHLDLIYVKNGGSVEITGGFFRCATPKWTLNKHDGTESTIVVKGGTFVNYNPAESETESPIANFVAEGYDVVAEEQANGEIWYTVVAAE